MDRHPWTSRAEVYKAGRPRTLPLSATLRAVLSMVLRDPEGRPHRPTALVFGNEVGEAVACIRESWGASRSIEAGWLLHHVRDMPGHENLTQTSTYLNATATACRQP
jgi:integrase